MKHIVNDIFKGGYRYLITVLSLFLLASCSPPWGPQCLSPTEIGVEIEEVIVPASGTDVSNGEEWTNSGISFSANTRIYSVKMEGTSTVQLCEAYPPLTTPISATNPWDPLVPTTDLWYVMDHYDEAAFTGGGITDGNWDPLSSEPQPIDEAPPHGNWVHLPYNANDQYGSNMSGTELNWSEARFEADQLARAGETITIRIEGRFASDRRATSNYDIIYPDASDPSATAGMIAERTNQTCTGACSSPLTLTRGAGLRGQLRFESGEIVDINFDFLADDDTTNDASAIVPQTPGPNAPDVLVDSNSDMGSGGGTGVYYVTHTFQLRPEDGSARLFLRHFDILDSDYTNNSEGYRVKIKYNGCYGAADGRYLFIRTGGTAPSATNATDDLNLHQSDHLSLDPDGAIQNPLTTGSTIWFKVMEPMDYVAKDYTDNTGFYKVEIVDIGSATANNAIFSSTLGFFFTTMRTILTGDDGSGTGMGFVERFYRGQVTDGGFVRLIKNMAIIYIAFTGVLYAAGMVRYTAYEFVVIVFKISVFLAIISDNSWEFFSEHFLNIFIEGIGQIAGLMTDALIESTGDAAYGANAISNFESFEWADKLIDPFLERSVWSRLFALIFTGPLALIYFLMIVTAIVKLFFVIIQAGISFLFSVIILTFLMALAPLFLATFLFSWTQPIFYRWLSMSLSAALQPVMLVVVVVFFTEVLKSIVYELLNYSVCWACVLEIYVPLDELWEPLPKIIFCIFRWWVPWGYDDNINYGNVYTPPMPLVMILLFYIFIDLFDKFVAWTTELTKAITNDFLGAQAMSGMVRQAMQTTGVAAAKNKADKFMKNTTARVAVGSVKALSVYGQFKAAQTGAKLLTQNGRRDIAGRAQLAADGASVKAQRAGRQMSAYKDSAFQRAAQVKNTVKSTARGIDSARRRAGHAIENYRDHRKYQAEKYTKQFENRASEAARRADANTSRFGAKSPMLDPKSGTKIDGSSNTND